MYPMFLLLVVLSVLGGCVQHIGNFSALATGTYVPENINEQHLAGKNIEGDSCKSIILFFPTGYPKADEAVSEALSKNRGDFMQNARLYSKHWYIPLIFGQTCFHVEGDVYKTIK
jgi:hypothetical protein